MLKVINDKSSFVVGNMVENASIILENIYIYIYMCVCVCVYISPHEQKTD